MDGVYDQQTFMGTRYCFIAGRRVFRQSGVRCRARREGDREDVGSPNDSIGNNSARLLNHMPMVPRRNLACFNTDVIIGIQ